MNTERPAFWQHHGVSLIASICIVSMAAVAQANETPLAPDHTDPVPTASANEPAPAPDATSGPEPLDRARELFWQAHERYDAEDYDTATKLFEQSYELSPQLEVLFNIALARARSGQCDPAEQAFEQYRVGVSEDAASSANSKFEPILRECREGKAAATVVPAPAPTQAPPVEPEVPHAPATAQAGQVSDSATPANSAPMPPPPAPGYWTTQRTVGWSLLGVAVVATGAAIYFDDRYRDGRAREEELRQNDASDAGDESAHLQARDLRAQIGRGITAGLALSAAVVGAGLIIYGENTQRAQVGVSLTDGIHLGMTTRF